MTYETLRHLILCYLLDHPDAGDTIEGIASWWVKQELLKLRTAQVEEVVRDLTAHDLLLEKEFAGQKVFFLNKDKASEIAELLKQR